MTDSEPADAVAAITRAVPGVADLHPGMFGEIGTYLPGRRVAGVRVGDDAIDIHITVWDGVAVRDTAAAVRAAVAAVRPGTPVNVTVEDVAALPATDRP